MKLSDACDNSETQSSCRLFAFLHARIVNEMDSETNSDSDTSSSTSSETSDEDFEEFLRDVNPECGVHPYQYEPQRALPSSSLSSDEESEEESDEEIQNSRLTSSDW